VSGTLKRDRILRIAGAVVVVLSLILLVGAAMAAGSNGTTDSSRSVNEPSVRVTPPATTGADQVPGDFTNEAGPIEGTTNPDARANAPIDGTDVPGNTQVLGTKQGPSDESANDAGVRLAVGAALLAVGLLVLLLPTVLRRRRGSSAGGST